jgi:2,4-dienoyl-CoA reductase-like NADH-dependent reductase (Old Yellow Enzyme family)
MSPTARIVASERGAQVRQLPLKNRRSPSHRQTAGGSLEQPKVVGVSLKDEGEDGPRASTLAREAYFVAFSGAGRKVAHMPVMVTGGFRSVASMVEALEGGDLDVVGLARPLIADLRDVCSPARLTSSRRPRRRCTRFTSWPGTACRLNGSATASTPTFP